MSVAAMPAAPGRLSTTTCWPSPAASCVETSRASRSLPPPGANGTMRRSGLVGYSAAAALKESAAAKAIPKKRRSVSKIIYVPFLYEAAGGVNRYGEPGSAGLAGADGGRGRTAEGERREPRGGDRRHRRHL